MSKNGSKTDDYEAALREHQIALVDTQAWAMENGLKLVVVFEGRDAAGKDGSIRVLSEHLSNRNTRIVALPKPSDRERGQWWFQRYADHLPTTGEWVFYNRSWYNRAGVERVMGFSTPQEQEAFLRDAPGFEHMLVGSGILLVKYWLDISKDEQKKRLDERNDDPLKRMKSSPLDAAAQDKWDAYSRARDEMLTRTHTAFAPWFVVRSDHKKRARLNLIRHLVATVGCPKVSVKLPPVDADLLFPFETSAIEEGRLER